MSPADKRISPAGWMLRMALRDGRKSWRRLLLYVSATSIGIGALIAAGSFRHNLQEAIRLQAKPLLSADLVVRSRRELPPEAAAYFQTLPYPKLREIELNTVVYFPGHDAGRLIELRAVEDGFPFYGEVKSDPPDAMSQVFAGRNVLLEETVVAEFGLKAGDSIHIGGAPFRIAGALKLVPGEALASVFAAPRAFISLADLPATGLIRQESLSRHRIYFRVDDESRIEEAVERIKAAPAKDTWRLTTVEGRQRSLGRRVSNADRFLKFAALIALLMGGIGVASVIFVYAKDKAPMAATLRCLGASSSRTLGVFLIQGLILGAAGTALGVALGVALQAAFPVFVRGFVTVDIPFSVSWASIAAGAAVGFIFTVLFTLLPLVGLRSVPPLAALRAGYESARPATRDPAVWAIGALLMGGLFLFARTQATRLWLAAAVPVGLAAALAILAVATSVSLKLLRGRVSPAWPLVWRQGLANLFRPNNQTHVLMSTLGLGGALIFSISFLNTSLLRHLSLSTQGEQATLALIDIQRPQRAGLREILAAERVTIIDETPFVGMRIHSLKGKEIEAEKKAEGERGAWALRHEYRSTYRNHLSSGEKVVKGAWPPPAWKDGPVPVSLEEEIAQDLGLSLGDDLAFNVQGLIVDSRVAAIRKVDWFQLRPNFFAVFPEGVLEEAPQFVVMLARPDSVQSAATLQRRAREAFPNVSVVDLRMVIETLTSYFDKVAVALRVMALFVVATGLVILAGSLISGRYERLREAALLRTLGASSRHIRGIHLTEYALVGLFAGLAGLVFGWVGSWSAARWLFEIPFDPGAGAVFSGLALMMGLSTGTGLFLGRGLLRRPPLQAVREEE